VKVRYQVNIHSTPPYKSITSAIKTIAKLEGFRALYQGLFPAVLASSLSWGGYFFFYESAKERFQWENSSHRSLSAFQQMYAAFEAGTIMVFITNPIWLIKTRMQLQQSHIQSLRPQYYTGFTNAVRTIFKEEGFVGFYKGLVPALFLVSHGVVQFLVYEQLKALFSRADLTSMHIFCIGLLSKVIASTVTYPYQVVKSRLQQREAHASMVYKNTLDCAIKTWRNEGMYGFFKGCIANSLRVAPGAAITFVVYEEMINFFNSDLYQKLSLKRN